MHSEYSGVAALEVAAGARLVVVCACPLRAWDCARCSVGRVLWTLRDSRRGALMLECC